MAADDVEVVKARGRLADAKRWFDHRGWDFLPDNDRGRLILTWAADHAWVAGTKNPRRSVRNWCRKYASPWLSDSELDEVVSQAEARNTPHPQRWSHDQSAVTLEYSISDRKELPLQFIGADDDPDYQWRNQHKLSMNAASARKYRAKRRSGRPCGRPRLDLSESEKVARKRKQSAESSARHRAANSSGAKRGRPKAAVPAWKAAGFNSKRSWRRHKANGTKNASAKTPSCDIKNIDRMTEFSVTEFGCQSAERLKRAGADHRLIVVESDTLAPVTGGCAAAPPPPPTDQAHQLAREYQ
jgi:hypothetical protein